MKPSQLIEGNGLFWSLIRSWAFASHGQQSFDAAKDIKDFLDKTIKLDNKQQKITNVTNYSYAMPIPEGYAFSQVGDVVSVAPFVAIEKAKEGPCMDGANYATHPDNGYVDRFAEAMKIKLNECRRNGKGHWDSEFDSFSGVGCTDDQLAELLLDSVKKGDPVDIANYAMMLYSRERMFDFSAKSLINDHASLGEAYEAQQKMNGETVLKVQAALGLPVDSWVSGDVVMMRLNQLKLEAEINTAPGTPMRTAIEASHMLSVETARKRTAEEQEAIHKAQVEESRKQAMSLGATIFNQLQGTHQPLVNVPDSEMNVDAFVPKNATGEMLNAKLGLTVMPAHQVEALANIENVVVNELKPMARKPYFPSALGISTEDATMWAKIHEAIIVGIKESGPGLTGSHLSEQVKGFFDLIVHNANMLLAKFLVEKRHPCDVNNLAIEFVRDEVWFVMEHHFSDGLANFFSGYVAKSIGNDIHAETMMWPGSFTIATAIVKSLKALAKTES